MEDTDRADVCCPRCGAAFHCGARGGTPCDCTALTLSPALLAALRQRHEGCLCLACLRALAAADLLSAAPGAAASSAR